MVLRIYRDSAFLDAATCARIRLAMDAGHVESAAVLHDRIEEQDAVRRAAYVEVEAAVLAEVEARLDARRAALAAFFGVPLTSREGAGFVRYPQGGFYKPHRDRAHLPSWPDAARRRIAVVAFLDDDFDGGLLRLLEGPSAEIVPRQGTLVAFDADLLHEVTPVHNGTRDAIVDWFY